MNQLLPSHMRQRKRIAFPLFLLLIMVSSAPLLCSNLYLPALPYIELELGVNRQQIASTLTYYMMPFALTTLIAGPMLDIFGRRLPVLIGLFIFLIGAVLCGFANSLDTLLFGRALQGFGGAVLPIAMRATLRDRLLDKPFVIQIGWMGIIIGLAPMLGPILGGILTPIFGWRSNFYLMDGWVLGIGIASVFFIKESYHPSKRLTFSILSIINSLKTVSTNVPLLSIILPISLCFLYSSFMITLAPFVLHDQNMGEASLGIFMLIYVAIAIGGRYLMIGMMRWFKESRIWMTGAYIVLISGVFLIFHALNITDNLYGLLPSLFLFAFGTGMMNPLGNKGAMNAIEGLGATSAALLMFMTVLFQAVGAWVCGIFLIKDVQNIQILSLIGIGTCVIIFALSIYSQRHFKQEIQI